MVILRLKILESTLKNLTRPTTLDRRIFMLQILDRREIIAPLSILTWLHGFNQQRLKRRDHHIAVVSGGQFAKLAGI